MWKVVTTATVASSAPFCKDGSRGVGRLEGCPHSGSSNPIPCIQALMDVRPSEEVKAMSGWKQQHLRSSYSPYPRENRLPGFLGTEKKKQIGGLPVTQALIEVMKSWGKLILKFRSGLSV